MGGFYRVRPKARGVARGLLASSLLLAVIGVHQAVTATPATDGNPDLQPRCGIDITLVIDRSGSIGDDNVAVRDAGRALIRALVGTGSRVQVVTFSTSATALVRSGPGTYSQSGDLDDLAYYDASLLTDLPSFNSSGGTNWDDGLEMARRSPAGVAPLTVILTDGDPTRHLMTAPDGHGLGTGGDGQVTSSDDIDRADQEADLLRSGSRPSGSATPTHLFAVGVGLADVANPPAASSEGRLRRITGDEQLTFTAGGEVRLNGSPGSFGAADYVIVDQFAQLETSFKQFVRELCAPSLNLVKFLQQADGTTVQATGATPRDFGLTISPGATSWQNPALVPGATAAQLTTDAQGRASFKWEPSPVNGTTAATIAELGSQPGYVFNGARCYRNDFSGTSTVIPGLATIPSNQVGSQAASASWAIPNGVGAGEGVSCEVYNRQLRPSMIQVDKTTVPAGLPQPWNYTLSSGATTLQTLTGIIHATPPTAFTAVLPGTYSVTESVVAGFGSSGSCDNQATPGDEALSPAGLVVGEAQTWRCTFTSTAIPGSIRIVKQASGAPVGTFSFTSNVPGLGAFQLTTGAGTATTAAAPAPVGTYSVAETNPAPWTATGATCSDGSPVGAIAVGPGEQVVCTFTNRAPAPTISVSKQADRSTVPETGATVQYTVSITNTSVEALTIDRIRDAVGGGAPADVTGTCDDLVDSAVPAGATVTCQFSLTASGDPGDVVGDVVTVDASDADGNDASDTGEASVTVTDVAPTVAVTKTPGVDEVLEPGGPVAYTVTVSNTSSEPLVVKAVTDAVDGSAPATVCPSLVETSIAPGGSATCTFTLPIAGNAGDVVGDTVSVVVEDDDGTRTTGTADASIEITDRLPTLQVVKTAAVDTVAEPGGPVSFTVQVTNPSAEPVVIASVADAVGGTTTPVCADLVGDSLAPGATRSCTFTAPVAGNAGAVVTDVITVHGADDEGNDAMATDDASVTITDVAPTIEVAKSAAPTSLPESGGPVTFTVELHNPSTEVVTITSLVDAVDGSPAVPLTAGSCGALVGSTLAAGASSSCTFTVAVPAGDAGGATTDVVTVHAADDDGGQEATASDDATVTYTDVEPGVSVTKEAGSATVPEPGADVTFTVNVVNTANEPATVQSIAEQVAGQPAGPAGGACATLVGAVLAPAGSPGFQQSCSFTLPVVGNAGDVVVDTVTVTLIDDDGGQASATDGASVSVTPVVPSLSVVKTADQPTVAETAGTAGFTVVVTNTSPFEAVTITSIVDAVGGAPAVAAGGTCAALIGTVLAPSTSASCSFEAPVTGAPGDDVHDVVTVGGVDDDDQTVSASDDASVGITDVVPALSATKTPSMASVSEPGADVTYSVTVTNESAEALVIESVTDVVGASAPIASPGTCADLVGTVLAAGATAECTFTLAVTGNGGATVADTVTVAASDDDGNMAEAQAPAVVAVTDADPTVAVAKLAVPPMVPEVGGAVTFTVTVSNTAFEDVTITGITDEVGGAVVDVAGLGDATDCDDLVGTTVAAQTSATCTFTVYVGGDAGDEVTDTVTVVVIDDEQGEASGSASATVDVDDVLPSIEVAKAAGVGSVPEPGADVTYTVTVTNTSVEPVTVGSVEEAVGGSSGPAGGTCADLVGAVLTAGEQRQCQFTAAVAGDAGDEVGDTVTVTATDGEGNETSDAGSEVVSVLDVAPTISVAKEAMSASVTEPGGDVTYAVTITNQSPEAVTITGLEDQIGDGGPFTPEGECAELIGTTLEIGASASCTFTAPVTGDAGDVVSDVVTVEVVDDDETPGGGSGSAVVDVDDALPGIEVTKTAATESVPEPGGDVDFEVTITNQGPELLTVVGIDDVIGGADPVAVDGSCAEVVGAVLEPGATTSCTFTAAVEGGGGDAVTDTVVVTAEDDEENRTEDRASATVDITDLAPTAVVGKTTSPGSVDEPGGTVRFDALLRNTSTEPLLITSLTDSVAGDTFPVTAIVGPVTETTCGSAIGAVVSPGATYSCTFDLVVEGNAGTTVVDTVRFGVRDDEGNDASFAASAEVDVDDVLPTITVTEDNGPGMVFAPGGEVLFVVTVTNRSSEAVTLVSLVESIDGEAPIDLTTVSGRLLGSTCTAGAVLAPSGEPGSSYSCTFRLRVEGLEAVLGTQVIEAVGVDDEGNEALAADAEVTAVVPHADVSITKEVVGTFGPTGSYLLTVANAGPSTATGLVVTDQLPPGLTATGAAGDGWMCAITDASTDVRCTRASLAVGAPSTITVTVALEPTTSSPVTNTAVVEARTLDDDPSNNRATSTDAIDTAVLAEVVTALPRTGGPVKGPLTLSAALFAAGTWLLLVDALRRRRPG